MSTIAMTDPSLIGDYRIVFERDIKNCTIRLNDEDVNKNINKYKAPQDQKPIEVIEDLKVKIGVKMQSDANSYLLNQANNSSSGIQECIESVKVEVFSDKDYFMVYKHTCNLCDFEDVRE